MKRQKSISDYIRATRGNEVSHRIEPEYYEQIWTILHATLCKMVDRELPLPHLEIAYSAAARTEHVLLGDRSFAIYDQYLGQIVSQVNRFLFSDTPHRRVDVYLDKIYALRLLASGREELALAQAVRYSSGMSGLESTAPHHSDEVRHKFVRAQEACILAHEMIHLVYASDKAAANVLEDYYRNTVLRAARIRDEEAAAHPLTIEDAADQYMADLDALFIRRGGDPVDIDLASDARREIRDRFIKDEPFRSFVGEAEKAFSSSAALTEELVCDGFAAMLIGLNHDELMLGLEDSLAATLVALHVVRMIKQIDGFIVAGPPGSNLDAGAIDRVTRVTSETVYRVSLHRLFTKALAATVFNQDEWAVDRIRSRWGYENIRFAAVINDTVLFHGHDDVWRFNEALPFFELLGGEIDVRKTVLMLCGVTEFDVNTLVDVDRALERLQGATGYNADADGS